MSCVTPDLLKRQEFTDIFSELNYSKLDAKNKTSLTKDDDEPTNDSDYELKKETSSKNLSDLLKNEEISEDTNFIFTPPKQPMGYKKKILLKPDLQNDKSGLFEVDACKFDSLLGCRRSEGRLGLALINTNGNDHLLLFRNNKKKISIATIDEYFTIKIRQDTTTKTYVIYEDNQNVSWSIYFSNNDDSERLLTNVAIKKAHLNLSIPIIQDLIIGSGIQIKEGHRIQVKCNFQKVSSKIESQLSSFSHDISMKNCQVTYSDTELGRYLIGMRTQGGKRFVVIPDHVTITDYPSQIGAIRVLYLETDQNDFIPKSKLIQKFRSKSETKKIIGLKPKEDANCSMKPNKNYIDLVLAETRLRDIEMRMTLNKLNDKIDKLSETHFQGQSIEVNNKAQQHNIGIQANLDDFFEISDDGSSTDLNTLRMENISLSQDILVLRGRLESEEENFSSKLSHQNYILPRKVLANFLKEISESLKTDVTYTNQEIMEFLNEKAAQFIHDSSMYFDSKTNEDVSDN